MKFGYQGTFYADDEHAFTNDEKVVYRCQRRSRT